MQFDDKIKELQLERTKLEQQLVKVIEKNDLIAFDQFIQNYFVNKLEEEIK